MDDISNLVGTVLAVLSLALVFGLLTWSLIWVYRDAEARGKSGCLVALLVFLLSWPLSLLVWIIFRPEPPGQVPPAPLAS